MTTYKSFPIVGQGARHFVVSASVSTVYRIEKDDSRNSFEECTSKLAYHRHVVERLFAPFVPPQRIVALGDLFVIETEYVQRGDVSVELKPKWIGEDSFVNVQRNRGYQKIFSPEGLWSRNPREVETALWSALQSDKPYLRIHRGNDVSKAINLVACALMERKIFSVFETIGRISEWANGIDCLPIAKLLLNQVPLEKTRVDICDLEHEEFVAAGKSLVTDPDPDQASRWINSYLTGRMVRDVSLILSFSSTPEDLGEPVFPVGDMYCRLAVIDTEIKPISKISS